MLERVFPFLLNVLMINVIIYAQISVHTSEHQLKGQEKGCSISARVQRGTAFLAYTMDTLRINCSIVHCGQMIIVTWCKYGRRDDCAHVKESDRIKIQWEQKQGHPSESYTFLHFSNISLEDSGLYSCKAINGSIYSISHSIDVSVLVQECRTEVTVPEKRWWNAPVLSSLMLSCTIKYVHELKSAVTWCKQQGESCIPLELGEKHIISQRQLDPNTKIHFLTFLNVSLSDSGEYLCMVHQREACKENTIFSPALRLNVTKSKLGALDLVLNIGRILLFITATVAIFLLTLCWTLKHKGKCCSRDVSSPQTWGQEDSYLPTPTQPQQSDMQKVTEDFQLSRLREL